MDAALALFARPAIAGRTKTRLIPALGPQGAAALSAAFLEDTIAKLRRCPQLEATLWTAGDPKHPSLASLAGRSMPVREQPDAPLGARIAIALGAGLRGHDTAIAIGSDAPTLPESLLRRAADTTARQPLALGPTADGGFYAIAAHRSIAPRLHALLAAVRWSSPHTLADTLLAAHKQGVAASLLPPWYDVDEPRDLALLRLHLSLAPRAAPATARTLVSSTFAEDQSNW